MDDQQPPADVQKGDVLREGHFFRNLKRKEVARRFEDDQKEPPEFGFKIKPKHWDDAQDPTRGDLSVNLAACARSPACSILLHPKPDTFRHVLEINLEELSKRIQESLVAQYHPIDEDDLRNLCHFEICSEESTTQALMKIKDCINEDFPPSRKKSPKTDPE